MSVDVGRLLSRLPPDTAESVLGWLAARGKGLPVHIPHKTIKFARECFALIDTDHSGSLEVHELRAVFAALGQPASAAQVTALVESVAGPGAASLTFAHFAQMMHGAVSGKQREQLELQQLVGAGGRDPQRHHGAGHGRPAAQASAPPPLNWADFHLLARAFRRRAVVDGVVRNEAGWRAKVLALAEQQAVTSRAAAGGAAAVWRHRTARLQQAAQPGMAAGAAAGTATPRPFTAGSDMLDGTVSAGATPRREALVAGIVVEEGGDSHPQVAAVAQGGGSSCAAATLLLHTKSTDPSDAAGGNDVSVLHATGSAAGEDERPPAAAEEGPAGFDWRRSAARVHLAAAASRQDAPPLAASSAGASSAHGTVAPLQPSTREAHSRLMAPTASSRAKAAPDAPAAACSRAGRHSAAQHGRLRCADRAAAQGQRVRLAAVALIKGDGATA